MPVTKSVVKNVRQNEKKRAVNKARKTRLKTTIAKFNAADNDNKKKLFPELQALIDKTVRKGVIHRNKGSRLKSKLMKDIK